MRAGVASLLLIDQVCLVESVVCFVIVFECTTGALRSNNSLDHSDRISETVNYVCE